MTDEDRRLVEAAAQAAGRKPYDPAEGWQWYGPVLRLSGHGGWNPLTDDGDAFRLMLDLKIKMFYVGDQPCADGVMQPGMTATESARRAIVRAAAAMDKTGGYRSMS